MQYSTNSPRRLRRWLRLALLIAGIGVLSVGGAAIGRGLGALGTQDAQARVGTTAPARTLVAVAAATIPTTAATTTRQPQPQPTPASAALPTAAEPAPTLAAATTTRQPQPQPTPPSTALPAGAVIPARMPRTAGGPDMLPLAMIAIALYLAGVALCVLPTVRTKHQRRSKDQ